MNSINYGLSIKEQLLKSNGSFISSNKILPGDQLIGDDGSPHTILKISSGVDQMYKIISENKESFVVSSKYKLRLMGPSPKLFKNLKQNVYKVEFYSDGEKQKKRFEGTSEEVYQEALLFLKSLKRDIVNISVEDYLQKDEKWKELYKGYRTSIMWKEKASYIQPYNLGLWLVYQENQHMYQVMLNRGLKKYGLDINNKFIPQHYKSNSYQVRQKLLAGIFDVKAEFDSEDSCKIQLNNEKLLNDIMEVAFSLGIEVEKINDQCLSLYAVDLKNIGKWKSKKLYRNEYYFDIEKLEVDKFYGLEVMGNSGLILKDYSVIAGN